MKVAFLVGMRIPPARDTKLDVFPGYGGIERTNWHKAIALDRLMGKDVTIFSHGLYRPKTAGWHEHTAGAWSFNPPGMSCDNGQTIRRFDEFDVIDYQSEPPYEMQPDHMICTLNGSGRWAREAKNIIILSPSMVGGGYLSPERYREGRYRMIGCCTDKEFYKFKEEKEDYFVYFSKIHEGKGTDIAVRLAKRMGFKLKVAGIDYNTPTSQMYSEYDLRYIEQIKKMCAGQKNIEYLSAVYNEDVVELLQNARAMLFPVRWSEVFGINVIESLSCGTPVVVGDNGGPQYTIEHGKTGFVCKGTKYDSVDWEEWEWAVNHVHMLDPKDCRKDVEERWDKIPHAKAYMKLYREIINGERW